MLNCKEVTRLISEGLDRRLSLWQRINLRMHMMWCGACATYKRQLEGLHRLFGLRWQRGGGSSPDPASDGHRLSPARREQIKHLMESESPGP
jgi:hypothetical protein